MGPVVALGLAAGTMNKDLETKVVWNVELGLWNEEYGMQNELCMERCAV